MHGGHHLSAERKAELVATATAMSQSGKGLTACDEGPGTIGDRFEKVGITNTEENRRLYRQMLFTVANGDQFLSGAYTLGRGCFPLGRGCFPHHPH